MKLTLDSRVFKALLFENNKVSKSFKSFMHVFIFWQNEPFPQVHKDLLVHSEPAFKPHTA